MADNGLADSFFKADGELIGRPQKDPGDRCLNCLQYSRCLDFAAEKDWPGFNCQGCAYEYQGARNFILLEFDAVDDGLDDEQTLHFINESQMESMITNRANQEDLLITFIEKGIIT
jgi:hypothetical protein